VLQYADLQEQLDIATVRELEDFIITECFYNNILKAKLDQRQRALQVRLRPAAACLVAGRVLRCRPLAWALACPGCERAGCRRGTVWQ
jgi:hypothetical protein